ncbi:MAG: DUF1207 domain-containing protein [Deltaproteobacteria bacterium]|nr:DUF1207 domain-containing protein [Deltaproteobacteria bacterium]
MQILKISLVFFLLLAVRELKASSPWAYETFPSQKFIFPGLVADPWETQCALFFMHHYKQHGKIGTRVPILQATQARVDLSTPKIIQMGVDLLVFQSMRYRKMEGGGFDLDSSDTKFGLHLEYDIHPWSFRMAFQHISAHLADGQLFPIHRRDKQSFSREFLQVVTAFQFAHFIPYLGFQNIFSQRHPKIYEGQNFFILQWGGELKIPLYRSMSFFIAADWQSKEEYEFYVNQSYFSGVSFKNKFNTEHRFSFHYFQGYDPRGEFFNENVSFWGVGLHSFI